MSWSSYQKKEIKCIEDTPKGALGFIYKIENLTNGKFYIGKKNLYSVTNPEISKKKYDELKLKGEPVRKTKNKAKSKKGEVVWRYKRRDYTTETNWVHYTGSNEPLNADIKSGDTIRKTILRFCYTKTELTYRELEQIVKHDCLDDCECYNGQVLSKIFKQVDCKNH